MSVKRDADGLTSRQRRREKHKEGCRKTHSHANLPVVTLPNGRQRRVPCSKCMTPRKQMRIGGGA